MKLLLAIFLTTFGTLAAQETPALFTSEANTAYNAAKLSQSEQNFNESAGLFKQAGDLFQKFVTENPEHPETATAYYRLGVSKLLIGKRSPAEEAFRSSLKASKNSGKVAASAAFRLAALAFNDKEFADAIPLFLISKNETDKPGLKAKSLNFLARCYIVSEQTDKAETTLEELIAFDHEDNTFKEEAQLSLEQLKTSEDDEQS